MLSLPSVPLPQLVLTIPPTTLISGVASPPTASPFVAVHNPSAVLPFDALSPPSVGSLPYPLELVPMAKLNFYTEQGSFQIFQMVTRLPQSSLVVVLGVRRAKRAEADRRAVLPPLPLALLLSVPQFKSPMMLMMLASGILMLGLPWMMVSPIPPRPALPPLLTFSFVSSHSVLALTTLRSIRSLLPLSQKNIDPEALNEASKMMSGGGSLKTLPARSSDDDLDPSSSLDKPATVLPPYSFAAATAAGGGKSSSGGKNGKGGGGKKKK